MATGSPPNRCGRYQLIERLALGGMAEIFLARDTSLDRKVVIKRLLPNLAQYPRYVAMFLDEARAIAAVDHDNIVRIFDIGFEDDQHFIAMELLLGWDLAEVIARARTLGTLVPIGVTLRLVEGVLAGLQAAHGAKTAEGTPLNLVHRDVSPHNLFVTTEGTPKLLDFGIAKTAVQRHLTEGNLIKGKPAYMSPEQLSGEPLDARSDIFSLGIVLHELLSGQPLFVRNSPQEILTAITADPILPPLRPGEEIAEPVLMLTRKALERNRALRFPTAAAMGEAIVRCIKEVAPTVSTPDVEVFLDNLFAMPPIEAGPTRSAKGPLTARATRAHTLWTELPTEPGNPSPPNSRDTLVDPPLDISVRAEEVFSNSPMVEDTIMTAVPQRTVPTGGPPEGAAVPLSASVPVADYASRIGRRRGVVALAGLAATLVVGALIFSLSTGSRQSSHEADPALEVEQTPASTPAPQQSIPSLATEAAGSETVGPSGKLPTDPPPSPRPSSIQAPPSVVNRHAPHRGTGRASAQGRQRPQSPRKRTPDAVFQAPGHLTLQSVPWAQVFIQGKLVGPTPLINYEVPAGEVRVRLLNPDSGLSIQRTFHIRPGETLKKTFELDP